MCNIIPLHSSVWKQSFLFNQIIKLKELQQMGCLQMPVLKNMHTLEDGGKEIVLPGCRESIGE